MERETDTGSIWKQQQATGFFLEEQSSACPRLSPIQRPTFPTNIIHLRGLCLLTPHCPSHEVLTWIIARPERRAEHVANYLRNVHYLGLWPGQLQTLLVQHYPTYFKSNTCVRWPQLFADHCPVCRAHLQNTQFLPTAPPPLCFSK